MSGAWNGCPTTEASTYPLSLHIVTLNMSRCTVLDENSASNVYVYDPIPDHAKPDGRLSCHKVGMSDSV